MGEVLRCKLIQRGQNFYDQFDLLICTSDSIIISNDNIECASSDSPVGEAVCKCVANSLYRFELNSFHYEIIDFKVLDKNTLNSFVELPIKDLRYKPGEAQLIHVYRGRSRCSAKHHITRPARASIINLRTERPVEINVVWCTTCNSFWIHSIALTEYRKQGIIPKVRLRYYDEASAKFGTMAAESTLKQYGYTTTMEQWRRWLLLDFLIESNIMCYGEILDHLIFCLDVPGNKPGNEMACIKWKNDYMYLVNKSYPEEPMYSGYIDEVDDDDDIFDFR